MGSVPVLSHFDHSYYEPFARDIRQMCFTVTVSYNLAPAANDSASYVEVRRNVMQSSPVALQEGFKDNK